MPECIFCAGDNLPTTPKNAPLWENFSWHVFWPWSVHPWSPWNPTERSTRRGRCFMMNGSIIENVTIVMKKPAMKLKGNLELYERHASLVHQRFELCAQTMRLQCIGARLPLNRPGRYESHVIHDDDLAAELVNIHAGVETQGGFRLRNALVRRT